MSELTRRKSAEHSGNTTGFTSETARAAVRHRWRNDPAGIAAAVQKIVDRAPALTPEQRELIRAALTVPVRADEP